MSEHHAALRWRRTSADFTYDTYNRAHDLLFNNGALVVPGSSAPEFRGHADRVDPEESLISALSSCHMLTFLAICARKRITVDSYEDEATGTLEKGSGGKLWVSRAVLRPKVEFAPGTAMDAAKLAEIHHIAHVECFIANSVKTEIAIEPR